MFVCLPWFCTFGLKGENKTGCWILLILRGSPTFYLEALYLSHQVSWGGHPTLAQVFPAQRQFLNLLTSQMSLFPESKSCWVGSMITHTHWLTCPQSFSLFSRQTLLRVELKPQTHYEMGYASREWPSALTAMSFKSFKHSFIFLDSRYFRHDGI